MLALSNGPFEAVLTPTGACAWLGSPHPSTADLDGVWIARARSASWRMCLPPGGCR